MAQHEVKSIVKTFSLNLKKAREKLELNQTELSKLVNASPSTVSLWENGKQQPTIEKLEVISKALRVEPYELFLDSSRPIRFPEDEAELYTALAIVAFSMFTTDCQFTSEAIDKHWKSSLELKLDNISEQFCDNLNSLEAYSGLFRKGMIESKMLSDIINAKIKEIKETASTGDD